jgi:ankyrin repeat protein
LGESLEHYSHPLSCVLPGGHYGNALQAASIEGHEGLVQLLLDKGASVNARGGEYGNALQAASAGGYAEVVELLRNKDATLTHKVNYTAPR